MATLAQTATGASGTGQPAHFAVFMCWVADPVDAWIVADFSVLWVYQYNFVVFPGGVGVDPVAVQYAQVAAYTANSFFGDAA